MKIIYYCLFIVALTSVMLYFLWLNADRPNKYANHFERVFIKNATTDLNVMQLGEDIRGFAGCTIEKLYFSTNDPGLVISTDYRFNYRSRETLDIPGPLKKIIDGRFSVQVDSPWIYVGANNIPSVFQYNMNTKKVSQYHKPGNAFSKLYVFSINRYLFRELDYKTRDQLFGVYDTQIKLPVRNESIVPQYGDGGMKTDGDLSFNKSVNLFAYTLLYSSKVFLFDTSLEVKKVFHTIDTINATTVETGRVNSGAYTNIGPKKKVNLSSCLNEDFIFVNSMLKADNENEDVFSKNSVIDIYKLDNGNYVGSFYVPRSHRRENIQSLFVFDEVIIACYRKEVVVCKLNLGKAYIGKG